MTRVLVLGAHPDDAEFFAGGLLTRHATLGSTLRLISVTNGQSGHHEVPSDLLIPRRREEARRAGQILESDYVTWDFPDGYLMPTIELRLAIIEEIRKFCPDVVLTHRPFDYHPDHRAVGLAVQDASYMVLVPKVAPNFQPPEREPIVAYMADLFTRPSPFRADVTMDVSEHWDSVISMLDCHESQFYEWMPWIDRISETVPKSSLDRRTWLEKWFHEKTAGRIDRFWRSNSGTIPRLVEAYEISEYAGKISPARIAELFPGAA